MCGFRPFPCLAETNLFPPEEDGKGAVISGANAPASCGRGGGQSGAPSSAGMRNRLPLRHVVRNESRFIRVRVAVMSNASHVGFI